MGVWKQFEGCVGPQSVWKVYLLMRHKSGWISSCISRSGWSKRSSRAVPSVQERWEKHFRKGRTSSSHWSHFSPWKTPTVTWWQTEAQKVWLCSSEYYTRDGTDMRDRFMESCSPEWHVYFHMLLTSCWWLTVGMDSVWTEGSKYEASLCPQTRFGSQHHHFCPKGFQRLRRSCWSALMWL